VSISEVSSRARLISFLKNFLGREIEAGTAASAGSFLAVNSDETLVFDTPAGGGGGDVSVSGTPSNNEVPTWTDSTTIKGEGNLTFDGSTLTVTGDTSITGDTTLGNASGDSVTINAQTIDVPNITTGTDDTVLVYNGSSIVTDEIDSKVWAGDLVDYTGTPVDSQVAIWTDTDTLEGDSDLTFDGSNLTVGGDLTVTGNDIKGSGGTAITMDGSNNVTVAGDLTVGGTNNGTGVRAEFLADAASVTNFGAYWETCAAHNVTADSVLKAVNSNNGQLYDMLGPATTTSNIYWYSCTATGAGGTATTERATDGLGANPFTGQHPCEPVDPEIAENRQDYVGLIVCSTGEFKRFDRCAQEWKTSKEGITINEALPRVALSSTSNDKSVFGVVSNRPNVYVQNPDTGEWEDDEDGVAIGFRDILSNQVRVNSLGEGAIWICNISGNLENGDYITTCEIPGLGMKQDDDLLHNYTVAKITQDCDFRINASNYNVVEFEFSGSTYRKAFVGCTYHCG